jgi:hypothetical protein
MHSPRTSVLFYLPALLLLATVACQSPQEREAQLKKNRMEKIWSAREIESLPGTPYTDLLARFGEPDKKNWWNPGFGTVTYDSIKVRSAINGEVKAYGLLLTIRENAVTDGALF